MRHMIPADVPRTHKDIYYSNYTAITRETDNLFLFACDHSVEHLNNDFVISNDHSKFLHIDHLFTIASQGSIGAMAAHYGLIARHAYSYSSINYIVKLNGKTPLLSLSEYEPYSAPLWTVDHALSLLEQGVAVRGVGITIYFGSERESEMLAYAARMIADAHAHGLLAVVWAYPRGKNIIDSSDMKLIAGISGVAHALGADFIKIHVPECKTDYVSIMRAADNSGIIFSGGEREDVDCLLKHVAEHMHNEGRGVALGRNIFQRPLPEAICLTKAISALVYDRISYEDALALYTSLVRLFC